MLLFLANLSTIFTPANELDTSSLTAMYDSLECSESMYVGGYDVSLEIKKSCKGLVGVEQPIARNLEEGISIVSHKDQNLPLSIVGSKNEWTEISEETLVSLLEDFEAIDGAGFRCHEVGVRSYTVQARDTKIKITDDTCQWDAVAQFGQIYSQQDVYAPASQAVASNH